MVRTSRIALALGLIVLAAASSTAAGASGPPVVLTEAGGAGPAPDPRWVARASTYDTACSASDADPAEYVQCIAMHVDASVSAPAHAADATCVLASLVADDALGLANCRFVAQHLGRAAFDAGAAARPAEAETAAREAFRACHASFCGGGCAQGVLVGMLVRAHAEGPGSSPAGDALAATAAGAFRVCAATPGAGAAANVSAAASADVADAAAPVTCATGIGQGLFSATKSLPSAVSLCHAAAITIADERADLAADRAALETRMHRACVSGALLRAALVKVKTLALDATASSFDATRDGLAAVCAPFAETVSRNNASSSSSAAASVADALHAPLRELNPALCGAALGRAVAMLTAPSFADGAQALGVAERLCVDAVEDPVIAGACAEAARVAAAARQPTEHSDAFPFCAAREEDAAKETFSFSAATDGSKSDDSANSSTAQELTARSPAGALEGLAENASAATNALAGPAPGCDAILQKGPDENVVSGFDFGFGGCALAAEGAGFRVATARGGSPEVASLPFCGEAVAYPIAAGNAAHHRAEDDGIAAVHARAVAVLETTAAFAADAEKEACAFALKTEMCRTAFSACDLTAGNAELEYCAHAHVPSFGAAASVVGVCSRPDGSVGDGENGDEEGLSENRKKNVGARVVCGARWNGVACFPLPAACGAARDTPEGTCPSDAGAFRGMSSGCFYASREADEKAARPEEVSGEAFAEFVAVPVNARAPPRALATPESAAACASLPLRGGGDDGVAVDEGIRSRSTAAHDAVAPADAEPSEVPRNATATARETIAVVREHAAEAFGRNEKSAENGTDPRLAFVRSDRETGGALWILCAQALVAGSLVAAAWTCARGWFGGGETGFSQPGFVWWGGASRAPNGGPAFFRLKRTRDAKPAPGDGSAAAELADLPTATKGSSLATLPKRGAAKGSPESKGARRAVEAPF